MPLDTSPIADANKAIVRRFFEELWNQGDLAFIEECMGPDITHSWGHETRASWREAVSAFRTGLPDLRFHLEELVAEGDTVAANTHVTATHRGVFHHRKWGPWPPTGKSIDLPVMIEVPRSARARWLTYTRYCFQIGSLSPSRSR